MAGYDLPSVEVEILVDAPPRRVWQLVTDIVLLGEWSPEYNGGEWLDGAAGPALGVQFRGRNSREGREWETTSTVVEADPDTAFAWAVGDPNNAVATWRFDLTAEGQGTRVRQKVQLGPGPSGLTRRIDELPDRRDDIIAARTGEHRRNMQATLQGLKAAAEQIT